jgi:biopolymer transport protein TolQ
MGRGDCPLWDFADLWTIKGYWSFSNGVSKGALILLIVMLLHALMVFVSRLRAYRVFLTRSAPLSAAMLSGFSRLSFHDAMRVANASRESHLAPVFHALQAARRAPAGLTRDEVAALATRASHRSQATVTAQVRVGLSTLATIAAVAPFVGLAGTVSGMFNSFRAWGTAAWFVRAWTANAVAMALVLSAAGLSVGIVASWFHNHLAVKARKLELQSSNAALQVTTYVNAHLHERSPDTGTDDVPAGQQIPYDRQPVLLAMLWVFWLYCVFGLVRGLFWHFHSS